MYDGVLLSVMRVRFPVDGHPQKIRIFDVSVRFG